MFNSCTAQFFSSCLRLFSGSQLQQNLWKHYIQYGHYFNLHFHHLAYGFAFVNELWRIFTARRKQCTGNSRHRVSVCLCVTRRYCNKTAKRRITQTTPRDSEGFSDAKIRRWTTPFPMKFALSDPPPFQTAQFRPIFAHSAPTVRASEKSSISANR